MSIPTTIYAALAANPNLTDLLARHRLDPSAPAIYEQWATEDTAAPYIVLGYTFDEGEHWARRDTIVTADILNFDGDTIKVEAIKEALVRTLDRAVLLMDPRTKVRVYLDSDQILPEGSDRVVHWQVQFLAIHWRNDFINHLNP